MRKNMLIPILLILFSTPEFLSGQVTISGPTCAMTGIPCQYSIHGSWDPTSTMQVCIKGGTIVDSNFTGNCTPHGAPLGAVIISWNNSSAGSISVTSSKGNTSLQVKITKVLQPGAIGHGELIQIIDSGNIPRAITCSPATAGACNPAYTYQWQASDNAVRWSNIEGATGQSLSFSGSLGQTTFYRRKVKETVSGATDYSDVATINVMLRNN